MILSTGTTTPPVDPPADPTNLIANPSFETANGANPAAWTSNSWGANAANFSYLSTGHTGTRSAKTTVTSYTDGDAKWYFAPVNVTAGKTYNYSVWYQANTATEVVVQYTNASGGVAYAWLGDVPASVNWAEAEFSFTVPSGVVKASVFHYVASVGSLTVDDASLTTSTTPPAPAVLVPNPSVETVSPTSPSAPDKWLSSNWGTNTPTYQYVDEGHTGGKSVKVSVANYVDGDAKWYFEPQAMQRGGTYKFSAWYKTNTIPKVVAMFQKDDGTERYFGS